MYKNKIKDLILTTLVTDAYCLGAHWVYDEEKLKSLPINWDELNPPQAMFHHAKDAGNFTHFGDQILWLCEFLAGKSQFDPQAYEAFWFEKMQTYEGYMDGSSRTTIENIKNSLTPSGANSTDLSIIGRIAPLLLVSKDKEEFYTNVASFIKVTHNSAQALMCGEFFAKLLIAVLDGEPLFEAIDNLKSNYPTEFSQMIEDGLSSKDKDSFEVIRDFGPACSINDGLSGVMHLLAKYDEFQTMLIQNAKAGGDSSARGMLAALIFKASNPSAQLPQNWLKISADLNLYM